ncbi:MAG: hypothetical protein A3F10_03065 [Coxiella sp. RIFCSPHIGHO2_12_FULL_42_15]|nr:MAG: hypothetical protein A3F10_03065 [Coxiella sp. RIFCSPHIGHO2_12_FULL_42_15]
MSFLGYLQPHWPVPNTVKAFTTTRKMQQTPPRGYEYFNLATHVGDTLAHVQYHRQQLQQELALPEMPTWLNQVHSNHVIELGNTTHPIEPKADASFTKAKNTVCAILTADCLPLLIYDPEQQQVAAVHGGWRGLHAGIIANTLQALHTTPSSLFVWLGPAISGENYEVGDEIYNSFTQQDKQFSLAFRKHGNRWRLDLYQIAILQLQQCGVAKIFHEPFCTYRQKDLFYSYRRDGQCTGRMATLIYQR